jgi:hypothetical protein
MRRVINNLMLLIFVALPLWLAGLWVVSRVVAGPQEGNRWPEASLFYFVVLAPQMLIGGLIHQFLLNAVPTDWSRTVRRGFAFITSFVVPVMLLIFGGSAALIFAPVNLLCLGAGLLVYSLLARLPERPASPA